MDSPMARWQTVLSTVDKDVTTVVCGHVRSRVRPYRRGVRLSRRGPWADDYLYARASDAEVLAAFHTRSASSG